MSALREREAGRLWQQPKQNAGAGHRVAVAITGILLASTGAVPAWCFGGGASTHPDYLAMLPASVQKMVVAKCNGSAHPRQYFATYLGNSAEMHLHYDRLSCDGPNRFCIATGCLHEVYVLHGNSYRLERRYYDSGDNDVSAASHSKAVAAH